MYLDIYYIILVVPAMLFAFWAQAKVSSTSKKYSRIANSRGMTGADAARMILDANGLYDVGIERINGDLTDHYDPKANVIRLSETTCDKISVTAIGVAAHEAGHAVVTKLLPNQDPVHQISIIPRGRAGGFCTSVRFPCRCTTARP